MSVYLQSYIIILGVFFEISGVLLTLSSHFSRGLYDESDFWFGQNDNKVINEIRNNTYGRSGTYLIVFGVVIQLSTMLHADYIFLMKASFLNITLLTMASLMAICMVDYTVVRGARKIINQKTIKYISNKLRDTLESGGRLHFLDGIRYIRYIDKDSDENISVEELKGQISELYNFDGIYQLEIHGV